MNPYYFNFEFYDNHFIIHYAYLTCLKPQKKNAIDLLNIKSNKYDVTLLSSSNDTSIIARINHSIKNFLKDMFPYKFP